MKDSELIDAIGRKIYQRDEYIKAMAEDMGISRNRLAAVLKGARMTPNDLECLRGLCERKAIMFHQAAHDLMNLAGEI